MSLEQCLAQLPQKRHASIEDSLTFSISCDMQQVYLPGIRLFCTNTTWVRLLCHNVQQVYLPVCCFCINTKLACLFVCKPPPVHPARECAAIPVAARLRHCPTSIGGGLSRLAPLHAQCRGATRSDLPLLSLVLSATAKSAQGPYQPADCPADPAATRRCRRCIEPGP